MKSKRAPESPQLSRSLGLEVERGSLSNRVREINESIACRAYELFEEGGQQHGHDIEDWLRAESEILQPIAVKTHEFDDMFITHARVPVETADEIQVSVEQRRIIISDRDRPNIPGPDEAGRGKRILCTVVLPDRVDWASAAMSFKDGTLEIEVPKLSIASDLTSD
jgi:HSP20 family molecular chaperone IbpA